MHELTKETIGAIARQHGLAADRIERVPTTGVINVVYKVDGVVLRVPSDTPAALSDTYTESVAAPVGWQAGVKTPRLVAFDDSRTIVGVPFTLYEHVDGDTLGLLELDPAETLDAYRALGADVARLHDAVSACPDPRGLLDRPAREDPRPWIEPLARDGYLDAAQARWLAKWLDALAPTALAYDGPQKFLHADLHARNLMVDRRDRGYLAMLDWGDAGWGDPALEFRCVPLRAVPAALEGYRSVRRIERDDTVEARILWDHLALAIERIRNLPDPREVPWRSRPAAPLLELLRFSFEATGSAWRAAFDGAHRRL